MTLGMQKSDKQFLVDLMNEVIAADAQVAIILWSVLSPEQREEFQGKLKSVIARDEALRQAPQHRIGILKALQKNIESVVSRQQPADIAARHLRLVPESDKG